MAADNKARRNRRIKVQLLQVDKQRGKAERGF
jgi:hypothetical protein